MGKHRYKPEDHSFGIIPYCIDQEQIYFLLIQHRSGHRAFPKGHSMDKETQLQTSLRELQEETGIKANDILINNPDTRYTEKYIFRYRGAPIRKTVKYLLGQCQTQYEINIQHAEIQDYRRCTYDEAIEITTFDASKDLLKQIHSRISKS